MPRKAGKYKQAPAGAGGPKPLRRRYKPYQKHVAHSSGAAAAADSSTLDRGSGVHPVLGLYVPHARRSYHRDAVVTADMAPHAITHHNGLADVRDYGMPTAVPTAQPAVHAQPRTGPSSLEAAKPQAPLRRLPSDSSMTVSASSNQD